jgi:hypothetical protein
MVAMLVLGFGLFSGMAFYTTSEIISESEANAARLAAANAPVAAETILPTLAQENSLPLAQPKATAMFNEVVEQTIFIDEAEVRAMSVGDTEGILLLAREGEVKTPEEVAALFSDDVSVKFIDDNTGVVSYADAVSGDVSEFTFVSVPVKAKEARSPLSAI